MIEFITIIQTGTGEPRQSSLGICDSDPADSLRTVGNLPHGYTWQPATARDRDALVSFLQGIEYRCTAEDFDTGQCIQEKGHKGPCMDDCGEFIGDPDSLSGVLENIARGLS